jgi:hypothetical protein
VRAAEMRIQLLRKKTGQEAQLPDLFIFMIVPGAQLVQAEIAMPASYCTFCSGRVGEQLFHISGSGLLILLCEVLYAVSEP